VPSNPQQGQYSVNTATGIYTFAAADSGAVLAITYGYNDIEDDVVAVVLEAITMRFHARGRDPMLMQRDQPQLGSERFWVQMGGGYLPPQLEARLDNYRVPTVA
jgi:hypothetical protein